MRVYALAAFMLLSLSVQSADYHSPGYDCSIALKDRADLQVIADKVALDSPTSQTLAMLANNKKPKKSEREALSRWVDAQDQCRAIDAAAGFSDSPAISAISQQYDNEVKNLVAKLYGGLITYGDFARSRADLLQQYNRDFYAIISAANTEAERQNAQRADDQKRSEEIAAQQQYQQQLLLQQQAFEARQAAEQNRQTAIQGAIQMMKPRPIIIQQPSYITTTCSPTFGGGMTCDSH